MRHTIDDYRDGWGYMGILNKPSEPFQLAEEFEARVFGDRDGEGVRFWIPSLYLLAGDLETANNCVERHLDANPNEYSLASPEFLTTALLILVKRDRYRSANSESSKRLRRLLAANRYVIPLLLGKKIDDKAISDLTNHSHYEYAASFPCWFYELWNCEDKKILSQAVDSIFNLTFVETWNEFRAQMSMLRPGKQRSRLIEEQAYFLKLMTED